MGVWACGCVLLIGGGMSDAMGKKTRVKLFRLCKKARFWLQSKKAVFGLQIRLRKKWPEFSDWWIQSKKLAVSGSATYVLTHLQLETLFVTIFLEVCVKRDFGALKALIVEKVSRKKIKRGF